MSFSSFEKYFTTLSVAGMKIDFIVDELQWSPVFCSRDVSIVMFLDSFL